MTNYFCAELNCNISNDNDFSERLYGITPAISSELNDLRKMVERKPEKALLLLQKAIVKYPQIPQFKNHLSVAYNALNKLDEAFELNRNMIIEYPNYIFSKLNLIAEYIEKEEINNAIEILGITFDINLFCPNRTEFHIMEVYSYIKYVVYCNTLKGNDEIAKKYINILSKVNKNMGFVLNEEIDNLKDYVIENSCNVILPDEFTNLPVLNCKVIEAIYRNDIHIDNDTLKEILEQPRVLLIADLHAVINHSISQFDYFNNETEWDKHTHEFLRHAIYILTELKSYESLQVILNLLNQDDEFIEYWFVDIIDEVFKKCIFILGQNNLTYLQELILKPNFNIDARITISEAVCQIALHYPNRRAEIIDWYKQIFNFVQNNKHNNDIVDPEWLTFMTIDLVCINAIELKDDIKQLYINNILPSSGKYVLKELSNPDAIVHVKELQFNIYDWYNYIAQSEIDLPYDDEDDDLSVYGIDYSNVDIVDDDDDDFYDEDENSFDDIFKSSPSYLNPTAPITNPNKNINRNDPCPCGSGKKYKKCCAK